MTQLLFTLGCSSLPALLLLQLILSGLSLPSSHFGMREGDVTILADDATAAPNQAPGCEQPSNVRVLVINMDDSTARLQRQRQRFARLGLAFERLQGVDAARDCFGGRNKSGVSHCMGVPRGSLPLRDLGCALSHRQAWRRAASAGNSSWWLVLEDDAVVHSADVLRKLPPLPPSASILNLGRTAAFRLWPADNLTRASSNADVSPQCTATGVSRVRSGYGLVGYVVSGASALRLLRATEAGFVVPVDIMFYPQVSGCLHLQQHADWPRLLTVYTNPARVRCGAVCCCPASRAAAP